VEGRGRLSSWRSEREAQRAGGCLVGGAKRGGEKRRPHNTRLSAPGAAAAALGRATGPRTSAKILWPHCPEGRFVSRETLCAGPEAGMGCLKPGLLARECPG